VRSSHLSVSDRSAYKFSKSGYDRGINRKRVTQLALTVSSVANSFIGDEKRETICLLSSDYGDLTTRDFG